MNICNTSCIQLHSDNMYGTIKTCIPHGKDGQRVNDGRKASFSKGGRPGVRDLRGYSEAVVASKDCTGRQTGQAMAHQAKHTGQPQGERNANRRVTISVSATPRLCTRSSSGRKRITLAGVTLCSIIARHTQQRKVASMPCFL
jgi:hypothetical protein